MTTGQVLGLFRSDAFNPVDSRTCRTLNAIVSDGRRLLGVIGALLRIRHRRTNGGALTLTSIGLRSLTAAIIRRLEPLTRTGKIAYRLTFARPPRPASRP